MTGGPARLGPTMSDRADAKTIAKALKFLAAGFDMMATAGVPAALRTLRTVEGSAEPVCEREKAVTAYCSVEMLQLGSFEARLPHASLLHPSVGRNASFLEGRMRRVRRSFGGLRSTGLRPIT